ncbi:MAG: hypothetical protein HXS49_11120 [Theionarchaea archaeon]|nr:hypothetical protein [Theionarchaea archaeon]MBU7035731.1 hypothetical protein [Theionarchaea archaeon]
MKRVLILIIIIAGCIGQQQLQFQSCSPAEQAVTIGEGEELEFSCVLTDSPNVSYMWYVDEEMVSQDSIFTFSEAPGTYTVAIEVTYGRETISHEWEVTVEESLASLDFSIIESKVEAIRGLKFLESVRRIVIDRMEMRENFLEDIQEDREAIEIEQKVYEALHVWNPEDDLFQVYIDVMTEQVASYYDTGDHTYYQVVDPGSPLAYQEFIASHELVHALQDQHHLLDFDTEDDDEYQAFLSLVEGDALLHQYEYLYKMPYQKQAEIFEYINHLEIPVVNQFLENLLVLRYDLGLNFVIEMRLTGIDNLYSRLPSSTEQVIHPDKYISNEQPLPSALPVIPEWECIAENTLGEAFIATFLKEHLDAEQAGAAASGWGGDTYGYYEWLDDYLFIINSYWDTEEDASEFFMAYYDFIASWSDGKVGKSGSNLYEIPTGFISFVWRDNQVIIVESSSRDAIELALSLLDSDSSLDCYKNVDSGLMFF